MKKLSANEARSLNGGYTCRACGYEIKSFATLLWLAPVHWWGKHGIHISDWKKAFC